MCQIVSVWNENQLKMLLLHSENNVSFKKKKIVKVVMIYFYEKFLEVNDVFMNKNSLPNIVVAAGRKFLLILYEDLLYD